MTAVHLIHGEPVGERILVECPQKQDKTASGLYVPQVSQDHERRAINHGRLLRAGLRALDIMEGRGWRLGDELTWGAYSPVILEWKDDEGAPHEALVLDIAAIFTNVDLAKRLHGGEQKIIRLAEADGSPCHIVKDMAALYRAPPDSEGASTTTTGNGELHADRR